MTTTIIEGETRTRPVLYLVRHSTLLLVIGILAVVVGVGSFAGGVFGAAYTYNQAVTEAVVTPDDAAIPGTPVRGPLAMWAQAEIIEEHQLARTDGLRYAEMPRLIPEVDEAGNQVLDEAGEPVMVPNEARTSWLTATTLTTALNLGLLAYGLSAFAMVTGLTLAGCGIAFLALRKQQVLA